MLDSGPGVSNSNTYSNRLAISIPMQGFHGDEVVKCLLCRINIYLIMEVSDQQVDEAWIGIVLFENPIVLCHLRVQGIKMVDIFHYI